MAIPVLDREGEGQPLVTYPSIADSSSSDNLTACPNRGAGPLSRHLRPVRKILKEGVKIKSNS